MIQFLKKLENETRQKFIKTLIKFKTEFTLNCCKEQVEAAVLFFCVWRGNLSAVLIKIWELSLLALITGLANNSDIVSRCWRLGSDRANCGVFFDLEEYLGFLEVWSWVKPHPEFSQIKPCFVCPSFEVFFSHWWCHLTK